MRVTLHYKHTNHSWLRYCSKEIIGLKLVGLLEHFSVPFAEIEKPRDTLYSEGRRRKKKGSTQSVPLRGDPPVFTLL